MAWRTAIALVMVVLAAALSNRVAQHSVSAGGGANCSDFSTWAQAELYFLAHGGSALDPAGLDADHDGIPCESLPGKPGNAATATAFVLNLSPTATRTPAVTSTRTSTPTIPPTATPTPSVEGSATLNGSVSLPGRSPGPVSLRITLYQPGTSSVIATPTATTDSSGNFSVPGLSPGPYDIELKQPQALSRMASGVTLLAGDNPRVAFGTLLLGDMNDDNAVSLQDYNILRAHFGTCENQAGFDARADLNGDSCISLQDYNLLRLNFGKTGPLAVA